MKSRFTFLSLYVFYLPLGTFLNKMCILCNILIVMNLLLGVLKCKGPNIFSTKINPVMKMYKLILKIPFSFYIIKEQLIIWIIPKSNCMQNMILEVKICSSFSSSSFFIYFWDFIIYNFSLPFSPSNFLITQLSSNLWLHSINFYCMHTCIFISIYSQI